MSPHLGASRDPTLLPASAGAPQDWTRSQNYPQKTCFCFVKEPEATSHSRPPVHSGMGGLRNKLSQDYSWPRLPNLGSPWSPVLWAEPLCGMPGASPACSSLGPFCAREMLSLASGLWSLFPHPNNPPLPQEFLMVPRKSNSSTSHLPCTQLTLAPSLAPHRVTGASSRK